MKCVNCVINKERKKKNKQTNKERKEKERKKERDRERIMFYLMIHSTHFYLQLYGVRHMVKDHSDS